MLEDLAGSSDKRVGLKQSIRAVEAGLVQTAFVAKDSEDKVRLPFLARCSKMQVEVEYVDSMEKLAQACNVEVPTAVAVLMK